jgi:ketosteroid isomerase-like protein
MYKILYFLVIVFLISCTKPINTKEIKNELLETDLQFSKLSAEKGRNEAFLQYIDSTAVLLRTNSEPIVGKENVIKLFEKEDDTGYTLTWKPLNAEVSVSGDLGFTYGIYELKVDSLIEKGTYTSIWKKNKKGEWKFVLDTGNKGLSSIPEL